MNQGRVGRAALVTALLGLVGCVGPEEAAATGAFKSRFACDRPVSVVRLSDMHYEVHGCEQRAQYTCVSENCTPRDVDSKSSDPPKRQFKGKVVVGTIPLSSEAELRLLAAPHDEQDVVELALVGRRTCELKLMVNGELVQIAASAGYESRARISRALLRDMVTADQLAVGACDNHFTFSASQVETLAHFARDYETELAWMGTPKASAPGMLAPFGGWPAWQALGPQPAAVTGANLEGDALYALLAPAILKVRALQGPGRGAQGSAVAVSTTDAITNCHVVEGSEKVELLQGTHTWQARIKASDPHIDRCVLSIGEPALSPVAHLRAYADLHVGETLYTLGAPSGLDLTLANGILSALRTEEGVRYVQTTAPISPGSSGGGLFDAHGNLVGITTLAVVGKERLNQSLNFAIAADAFWSP